MISVKNIILGALLGYVIILGVRSYANQKLDIVQVEITKDGLMPTDIDPGNFWVTEDSEVTVLPDNETILITGPIEESTAKKFKSLLTDKIKLVAISSPGGEVVSSVAISAEIYKRHIDTLVPDGAECFSGCTIIFQAGARRFAYENSMFAYHSAKAKLKNGQEQVSVYGTSIYWAYLLLYDIEPKIFDVMTDMQTDYFITATTSKEYNIVTDLILVDEKSDLVHTVTS